MLSKQIIQLILVRSLKCINIDSRQMVYKGIFRIGFVSIGQLQIKQLQIFITKIMKTNCSSQSRLITLPTAGFCFKYFINLGNDKFGSMTITDQTNLYQEAQRFCRQHQLSPEIAVILQNEMFQQTLRNKQKSISQPSQIFHNNSRSKSIGKIQKNYIQATVLKANSPQASQMLQSSNRTKPNYYESKAIKPETMVLKNSGRSKCKQRRRTNSKHFQQMYKKYEQIQSKKQLIRKASYERMPFKPMINNLSRKIVQTKRSTKKSNEKAINRPKVPTLKLKAINKQNSPLAISFRKQQEQN